MKKQNVDNLIIVDGYCKLCHHAARLIMKNDRKGIFNFITNQSAEARKHFKYKSSYEIIPDSVVFIEEGKVYTKSAAALRIARKMNLPWPALYPLILIPRPVRDFFYDIIARYRYRLFGKKVTCSLPAQQKDKNPEKI
jgi:predicted DCC family thiol-disulfide oxidoreductase YuxK